MSFAYERRGKIGMTKEPVEGPIDLLAIWKKVQKRKLEANESS